MPDILDSLEPYFATVNEHDEEKLDELHAVFQEHFMDNPFYLDGKLVRVKRHVYNPQKDGLPDYFTHYFEKFVHVVSRTIATKKGNKQREFRPERANRIHWIKPILENYTDARISNFRFLENNGKIRDYFWYKAKDFIVVMEEVIPDYYLITGFCVDRENRVYYAKKEANCLK
ncbi:MAG: hypothetical protein LWW85_03810 [Marinilabiliales bacterium]|nr:hypothetical protein [Marinilabiliales bacterium]